MNTNAGPEDMFIRKRLALVCELLKCPFCNGSKIVKSIGGMESRCNQCGKFIAYLNHYCVQPTERYITTPIMAHLVKVTTLAFFIITLVAFYDPVPAKIAGAVSLFGSIFVALKFKLDQASYHKDLFQKRYEIFLVINDVLGDWSREAKSTKEMIGKVSGDLLRRSYFIFGKHTYEFVKEFRLALIYTETGLNETDDVTFRKQIQLSRDFLSSIMVGQDLADKFPELKINYY